MVRRHIEIFDRYHAFDVVDLAVADRIDRMGFTDDLFLHGLFVLVEVEPDNIAPVGHQGSDIPVPEMKDPFYNILFDFFDRALFGAFVDDGLDLVFRDGTILRRTDRKQFEKEVAGVVEQPYEWMGDPRQDPYGPGDEACDLFGPQQADPLGDEFAADDGRQGHENEDQSG